MTSRHPRVSLPQAITAGLLLGGLSLGASGVTVTLSDADTANQACGNLKDLQITQGGVTLATDGACIGAQVSATPDVPASRGPVAVTQWAEVTINLSDQAVVKLPLGPATITRQPSHGTVSVSGALATYKAETAGDDSFDFSLKDASGRADTGRVHLSVAQASDKVAAPTGCAESYQTACGKATNRCADMDENRAWKQQVIAPGQTHIYKFTYNSPSSRHLYGPTGDFTWMRGHMKEVAISDCPGETHPSPRSNCGPIEAHESSIKYGQTRYDCVLEDGKVYYFNLKTLSTSLDTYDMEAL